MQLKSNIHWFLDEGLSTKILKKHKCSPKKSM